MQYNSPALVPITVLKYHPVRGEQKARERGRWKHRWRQADSTELLSYRDWLSKWSPETGSSGLLSSASCECKSDRERKSLREERTSALPQPKEIDMDNMEIIMQVHMHNLYSWTPVGPYVKLEPDSASGLYQPLKEISGS